MKTDTPTTARLIAVCDTALDDCPDTSLSMPADLLHAAFSALARLGVAAMPRYRIGQRVAYEGIDVTVLRRDLSGDGRGHFVYQISDTKWASEDELQP